MNSDILRKGKHQYYNINPARVKDIVYQSNNLKKVKDAIPALKEIGKFNI